MSRLAHRYLDGLAGIEIGGSAHNAFGLNTRNVDYTASLDTSFKRAEIGYVGRAMPVDIVARAEELPLADSSVDFVLTSHVLEHMWNPVLALREWRRVTRPGGFCFAIIPHPDRTFDRGRATTTLAELQGRTGRPVPPQEHVNVFRPEMIAEVFDAAGGYRILEIQEPDDRVSNGFTVVAQVEKARPDRRPVELRHRCGDPQNRDEFSIQVQPLALD